MMPDLLVYLLKVNGALLLLVAVYYGLLRHLTFHTLNRWYLLGAIAFSALYPLVDVAALWLRPVDLGSDLLVWQSSWNSRAAMGDSSIDYYSWVLVLYWAGVAGLGTRLIMQGLSLRRVHRASAPADGRLFRQITEAVTPFSFWQTIYVNPAQHHPTELPAILLHEQVHVQQWHTLDVLLGQLQRVFCWLNPAAWLLLRAMQENLEFIADQAVIRAGQVDSKVYQYSLVQLSTLALGPALVTPFTFHTLKSRIKMMNSQKTSAIHMARYLLVAPLAAALLLGSCSKTEQKPAAQPAAKGIQTTIDNALYFVDGKKSTKEAVEQLNPDAIASMNVLKGEEARSRFGEAAGAIVITTKIKQNSAAVVAFNEQFSQPIATTEALIFIDGKEAAEAELNQLPQASIKEMNVLKGSAAEQQYGFRGRNGVIQVTTGAKGTRRLNQVHARNDVMSITN